MIVELLDETEARQKTRAMIDSRDWWIIPAISKAALAFMTQGEEAYYQDEANEDFLIHVGFVPPGVPLGVAFAHKRHASVPEMARLMVDTQCGGGATRRPGQRRRLARSAWEDRLKVQDVLLVVAFAGEEDESHAVNLAMAWHDWVVGDDGWKPAGTEEER